MSITAGQWTPTGWGAQHLVTATNPQWTTLACHRPGQRVATERINPAAAETARCTRCPLDAPPVPKVGQVRRREDGTTVVCGRIWDDRIPLSPTDRVWQVTVSPSGEPVVGACLDGYTVARWPLVGGEGT